MNKSIYVNEKSKIRNQKNHIIYYKRLTRSEFNLISEGIRREFPLVHENLLDLYNKYRSLRIHLSMFQTMTDQQICYYEKLIEISVDTIKDICVLYEPFIVRRKITNIFNNIQNNKIKNGEGTNSSYVPTRDIPFPKGCPEDSSQEKTSSNR